MLVIEKNKLYEKIKKEREKIDLFKQLFLTPLLFSFLTLFFIESYFNTNLNNENIVYFLFLLSLFVFSIYLSFKSMSTLYKSYKYIEYGQKELNKIYEPDVFLKISEELILLEENKNLSLINKNFINKILNHKRDNSSLKEKLSVLKKVSQSIENN